MKKSRIFAIIMAATMLMTCLFAGSAMADGTLKIGCTGPLTGDASSYGISVQQGAQLAIDEINAAGGVNGYELEFNMIDDKAAAADATTGFGQLMDWGMQASLGSVTSGSCEAFGQQAAQYHVFFLTPSASAASVIATGDTAFRVCFGDPDQGTLAAEELTSRFDKIGCIYDTSDTYSSGIYAAFDEKMKELGVDYETFTFDADNKKSFAAQVEALKDCQVIFCPFYYTEASLVAKECSSAGHGDILLFGCDGFDGLAPLLDDTVTNPIEYITPFDVEATDDLTADFVTNYTEEYGAAPDQFAADGYDCIYTIKACLEAAGVDDPTIDFAALTDILVAQITADDFSYDGVTGSMTWDETGACTKIPVIVILN